VNRARSVESNNFQKASQDGWARPVARPSVTLSASPASQKVSKSSFWQKYTPASASRLVAGFGASALPRGFSASQPAEPSGTQSNNNRDSRHRRKQAQYSFDFGTLTPSSATVSQLLSRYTALRCLRLRRTYYFLQFDWHSSWIFVVVVHNDVAWYAFWAWSVEFGLM